MNTITQKQKEAAKARIFETLASAVSQTSKEEWYAVMIRAKEVIEIAKQLEDSEVEN